MECFFQYAATSMLPRLTPCESPRLGSSFWLPEWYLRGGQFLDLHCTRNNCLPACPASTQPRRSPRLLHLSAVPAHGPEPPRRAAKPAAKKLAAVAKKASTKAAPQSLGVAYETSRAPSIVIGVDEAGRGPLAGPVTAGACALPATFRLRQRVQSPNLQR